MHTLITADTIGGVWTYTRELVTGLVQRGVRVTLVSFGNIPAAGETRWMDQLSGVDYHPTAFKLEWMQNEEAQADLETSAQYLGHIIRDSRPDLLHLNQFYYGALDCNLPRLVVAHSDVVSWWACVHGEDPPPTPWMSRYREVVARGLAAASAVVAPSRWMLDQVERNYLKPARGLVIHNGRTPALFNPRVAKEERIVTIGRSWDAGKNTTLLLRMDMPAPVYIVGSERHPEKHEIAPASHSPRASVRLQSHQQERAVVQLLARAGIYAATSRYEPFGLAPVEAALSRCAVVASDIPSFRELWEGAALFFCNNDAPELRKILEILVRDPALRRKYGNLAYEHARRKFTAARMVDRYLELYQTLVPRAVAA
jgi:glycosyltransferase involved in cell wall biosynthesis